MSPKDPLPIFLPSLYLFPTRRSMAVMTIYLLTSRTAIFFNKPQTKVQKLVTELKPVVSCWTPPIPSFLFQLHATPPTLPNPWEEFRSFNRTSVFTITFLKYQLIKHHNIHPKRKLGDCRLCSSKFHVPFFPLVRRWKWILSPDPLTAPGLQLSKAFHPHSGTQT